MHLGAFSVSLNVQDLGASIAFYEKLGFRPFHDERENGYAILKNGETVLGLFGGFIERTTLTFNPGWDQAAQPVGDFTDVREIQARLRAAGLEIDQEADPDGTGPAHIVLTDPDGNPVLIDQHVARPEGGAPR
ncbi:VOC family protein [Rhodobacteraceae bacterium CCMM004]|nr:VOC family protein [Rhodobacteraceae bacterium CCMM004]